MTKKTWLIFILIVGALFAALIASSKSSSSQIDTSKIDTSVVVAASDENGNIADHVFGKADSKVVLVEYGDYQCPACGSNAPRIKAIAETYKDYVAFVFRNFPLSSIHANALAGSGAAEAAGLQGKYWEMHDLLYKKQNEWSTLTTDERTNKFTDYAKELSLDTDKFKTDMALASVTKKISFDQALGKKDQINSTPSFRLGGKVVEPATWSNDTEFKKYIEEALKTAGIEYKAPTN